MKQPLVQQQKPSNFFTKYTMNMIGLGSAAAYSACYFQKFDTNNPTGQGLWYAAVSLGLITSAMTMLSSNCWCPTEEQLFDESKMTWRQYIPYVAKSMLNPCTDSRRYYAFGNAIANCLLMPAEVLNIGTYLAARYALQPLYYVAQFTALAGPVKSENAYIAWGAVKTVFQGISLWASFKEPEKFAPIIVTNVAFTATSLFAIISGIYNKCADRKEAASIGV